MAFPTSPSDGDLYKGYVYSSSTGTWKMDRTIERGQSSDVEWVKYENGIIDQWSRKTVNSVAGTFSEDITFPVQFVGLPSFVSVSSDSASSAGGSLAIIPNDISTTGFSWRKDSSAVTSMERMWFARGKYK